MCAHSAPPWLPVERVWCKAAHRPSYPLHHSFLSSSTQGGAHSMEPPRRRATEPARIFHAAAARGQSLRQRTTSREVCIPPSPLENSRYYQDLRALRQDASNWTNALIGASGFRKCACAPSPGLRPFSLCQRKSSMVARQVHGQLPLLASSMR